MLQKRAKIICKQFKKIIIICFIILLIPSGYLLAGDDLSAEGLSLEQLLKAGLNNNFTIKESQLEREMAELDYKFAKRSIFPELTLNTSYTRLEEGPQIPAGFELIKNPVNNDLVGIKPLYKEGPPDVYNTGLSLQQPIYMSGKIWTGIEIAGRGLELAQIKEEMTTEEVILQIVQAYYNVLMARERVEIEEQALQMVREHKKAARISFKAGMALKTDLLQADIEEGNSLHSLRNARNQLQLARKSLSNLTGVELKGIQLKEIEIEPEIFSPYNIKIKNGKEVEGNHNKNLATIYDTALEKRSDLQLLNLNRELTGLNLELEKKANFPDIFISANYKWQDDEFNLADGSWDLTLGLSMKVFDGGRSRLKQKKLEKELVRLEKNSSNIRNMVELELERSLFNIEQNKKNIDLQELNRVKARENLNLEEKRYKAGMGSYLDVMNARTMLKNANTSLVFARYHYQLSLFELLQKTGQLSNYFKGVTGDE